MHRLASPLVTAATLMFLALPAHAQTVVDRTLILHPGDTITWDPQDDHIVLFGLAGLTKFSAVAKLLEFNSAEVTCAVTADTCAVFTPGTKFTATVRSDIDFSSAGVVAFNFTCGVHNDMIASPFTIEPATVPGFLDEAPARRDLVITTTDLSWALEDGTILNRHPHM